MKLPYARRMEEVKASEVRELLKLINRKDMISFGGGLPAEETFPLDTMKDICNEVIEEYGVSSMQYSTTEGFNELREIILKLLSEKECYGNIDEVLITSGSQQGLDLTGKLFLDEGDIVLCESPTYLAVINAFKAYGARFVEVDMEENGLCLEDLEKKLKEFPQAKFLYTIPDYQNPTGIQMSLEKRKGLIKLANKYDLIIVEDNPYSELNYNGVKLPPVKAFDTEGRVIYLSTFSKVVCPGFRTGWIFAREDIVRKFTLLKQGTDLHTNIFTQMLIYSFYKNYDVNRHIEKSIAIYKKKKDKMLEALEKYFPKEASFTKPTGGLFLWVTLPEKIDSRELLKEALEVGVAFVSGSAFYPNGGHYNTMRLNFSSVNEEEIEEGIRRLGEVIKMFIETV